MSETVQALMFDYEDLSPAELDALCERLPNKMLRWVGIHHPDNRTRKLFYRKTGVTIGEGTVINANFVVSDGYQPFLSIGCRVAIAPNVTVICQSAPNNSRLAHRDDADELGICEREVVVEDDAWLGAGCTILPGVRVGARAIVGAGAVVTRHVAPDTVVAGVPATVTRNLATPGEGRQTCP